MITKGEIKSYSEKSKEELINLLTSLAVIPAPSHHEEKRAEFCKKWADNIGISARIDDALNVIYSFGDENSDDITVFLAHTDTVFPDTEPFVPRIENGIIHCPGIFDNTGSLAVLMMTAKFMKESGFKPRGCVLFVCNSCEEGLGNLKGIRQIMKDYGSKVKRVYSYDSTFSKIATTCVGSARYEVEVLTEGGHSFLAFGNCNAIHQLSLLINYLYSVKLPERGGSKTTYNVGGIEGGTSVNTIAQNAKMLYEYRSDNNECLAYMENFFNSTLEKYRNKGLTINVKELGIRPCMKGVDISKIDEMYDRCKEIIESHIDVVCQPNLSSTDCNIPLSMGIPAICLGVSSGTGLHTREETLDLTTLHKGLAISMELALDYFKN